MVSRTIAIIPARGGSKRLPGKNVLDFYGKPMLAWTIEAARESGCFHRVLVSTDDPATAAIARDYGAEVPFLRAAAYDDTSTASEASIVALHQAEAHWGETYAVVAQLMPNCPLRSARDIKGAVADFTVARSSGQISCFRFGWQNPWWAATVDQAGKPDYLFPEERFARSQDLPPLYCPSGAIWLATRERLLEAATFYVDGHVFRALDWMAAMDIDDTEDLLMAKACYLALHSSTDGYPSK